MFRLTVSLKDLDAVQDRVGPIESSVTLFGETFEEAHELLDLLLTVHAIYESDPVIPGRPV